MSLTKKCHCCGGSGTERDDASIGRKFRQMRDKDGISLRQMASMIGVSPSFLSQLENGKRAWTLGVRSKYEAILKP